MRYGDLVMYDDRSHFGIVVAAGDKRVTVVWDDDKRRYYVKHQWYRLVPVPQELETAARKALAQENRRAAQEVKTPIEFVHKVTDWCGSHPDGGSHECLASEMRCAYCGVRLAPYPCNGCGKFLTAKHMHEAAEGESWRCEECRGF